VFSLRSFAASAPAIATIGKKKIKVDDYLRTTNKDVLLSGDIAGGFQFTHASELHAKTIINNFFSPLKKKLIYDNFSWVTYTSPEIANFGLSEIQLNEKGINYEKLEHDLRNDDRAITDDYKEGKAIFYISKNKLLGGSMIANNAGELIEFGTAEQIFEKPFSSFRDN